MTAAVGIASTAPVAQHPQLTLTVLETIRSLPKSVTEVRISTPELFEPRERLNAGLQAISRLIVREV